MIPSTRSLVTSLLIAGSLTAPQWTPEAAAQPRPHKRPSQAEITAARRHFQSAEAAKARADYRTAAAEYLAAYELYPDPAFFYDAAEVYRLDGDERAAVTCYDRYLELDPQGPGAAASRSAVEQLRRSIAAKDAAIRDAAARDAAARDAAARDAAARDVAARKADSDAAAGDGAAKDAAAKNSAAKNSAARDAAVRDAAAKDAAAGTSRQAAGGRRAVRSDVPEDTAAPAQPPRAAEQASARPANRRLRIAGLAAGGAGLAAIGVGIAFGVRARNIGNDTASWVTYDHVRDEQARADQTRMFVLTGIGGAAVVTGAILYYVGRDAPEPRSRVSLVPVVGPSQVALVASGGF